MRIARALVLIGLIVEGRSPAPWMISRRRCGDGGVSIGPYPEISLSEARAKHMELRKRDVVDKADPLAERRAARQAAAGLQAVQHAPSGGGLSRGIACVPCAAAVEPSLTPGRCLDARPRRRSPIIIAGYLLTQSTPKVCFREIDDLVASTVDDRLHHVEGEALRHLQGN